MVTMAKHSWWNVVIVVGSAALGACGGDDDGESMEPVPDAGGGTGGTMMTGGTGGSTAGTGGTGGTTPPPPMAITIMCGPTTCTQQPSLLSTLAAMFGGGAASGLVPTPMPCCRDGNMCGVMTATSMCEEPATADTRCPSLMLPGLLAGLAAGLGAGCCTPEGMCGLDGAPFGRGCVENSEAAMSLMGAASMIPDGGLPTGGAGGSGGGLGGLLGGMPLSFPEAQRCDGSDLEGGTDLDGGS
jgi:hypothetical protein